MKTLFLFDDIAGNLKPAEKLGITTIKVRNQNNFLCLISCPQVNDVPSALVKLQKVMDLDLGHVPGTSKIRIGMDIDQASLKKYLVQSLNLIEGNISFLVSKCSLIFQ